MQSWQILAIKDDSILGTHLKSSLEDQGYRVTLVADGHRGLSMACDNHFDLILLDLLLPGLSGLDLLSRLRGWRRTPVIVMSALGDEAHRIRGFDGGADDYLPKPFSIAELRVRIEAVLRRVAYERARPQSGPMGALLFDEERGDINHRGHWLGLTTTEYACWSCCSAMPGKC